MPLEKRVFDLIVGSAMALLIMPTFLLFALAILVLEGRPVFYVSQRRSGPGPAMPIAKFRTMRRDADRIANRETVPVATQRFLNLPITSPLYTPVGRLVERLMLTEMPQLRDVLAGRMSVIGNRPLPDNVVASLREEFPNVEERFLAPAGLTGPIQLIGREAVSDADRLRIEIAYCHLVRTAYSPLLDLNILIATVVGGIIENRRMTPQDVLALLARYSARRPLATRPATPGAANLLPDFPAMRAPDATPHGCRTPPP